MLDQLSTLTNYESRSISAENVRGEKGKGGMALESNVDAPARHLGQGWKVAPAYQIAPGEVYEVADIDGPGAIRHIWMTVGTERNRKLILRMYWEGSDTPSVEVPLCDFFASALHANFAQISSIPVCVNPNKGFNCYWNMPFYKHCRITVENIYKDPIVLFYQIDYILGDIPKGQGYFHAQFRRTNPVKYKDVYTILDNVEGKGQYVGTYMLWGTNSNGWWGEGEIKFYMDGDKEFPTICGTGTEDYFCGAYCFTKEGEWKYMEYTTPYSGMPQVIRPDGSIFNAMTRFSLYRWHITDPIYFHKDLRITMQALGWDHDGHFRPLMDDLSSVAFWYQDSICKTFPKLPSEAELEIF